MYRKNTRGCCVPDRRILIPGSLILVLEALPVPVFLVQFPEGAGGLSPALLCTVLVCAELLILLFIFRRMLSQAVSNTVHEFWEVLQCIVLTVVFCLFLRRVLCLPALFWRSWPSSAIRREYFPALLLPAAVSVSILSVIRELLLRGVLFGTLYGRLKYAAYLFPFAVEACALLILSGASAASAWPAALLGAVPGAVAYGWGYAKSGNLLVPAAAHVITSLICAGFLNF